MVRMRLTQLRQADLNLLVVVSNPAIKILRPPAAISTFRYVMTWHPRLNTDAAHTWLRATMRDIGGKV